MGVYGHNATPTVPPAKSLDGHTKNNRKVYSATIFLFSKRKMALSRSLPNPKQKNKKPSNTVLNSKSF